MQNLSKVKQFMQHEKYYALKVKCNYYRIQCYIFKTKNWKSLM
jgi:hypothetical protein